MRMPRFVQPTDWQSVARGASSPSNGRRGNGFLLCLVVSLLWIVSGVAVSRMIIPLSLIISRVGFAYWDSATGGYDATRLPGQFTEDVGLDFAEHVLAILHEYFWYRLSDPVLNEVVHIDEREFKQFRRPDSAERLSSA